tara:strand:+ start:5213 stop:5500 length:288 start_codon:yes stop_codon:yes gene_type:complete
MYQALPEGIFIGHSPIAGQGVFGTKDIPLGTELGMSHLIIGEEIIRTPLGGFLNHSDNPNCEKYRKKDRYYIRTIKPIGPMEELTLKYTFYEVAK